MSIATVILDQLGGQSFIAMTGTNHFMDAGNTLRMNLPRNQSRANRLWITLTPEDDYTMRFFHYRRAGLDTKTGKWIAEKVTEIKTVSGVYCDTLQQTFTNVTGMNTHL